MKLSQAGSEAAAFTLFREHFDPHVVARFTIDGEPVSKSRARFTKRGSKTHAYTPDKTYQAEQAVAWKFRQAAPGHRPDPNATYGVVALFFSGTRQRRDVDNMVKLVLDGLTGVAWPDDDQVVEISGRKSLGPPEGARTEIAVYKVGRVYRPTADCEFCGKAYDTYASWKKRRFCSQECGYAWRRERRTRNCRQCGVEFTAGKVQTPAVFCSRACVDASKRATVTCTGCGRKFTKPRCHVRATNYCSDGCRDAHWRAHRKSAAKGTCATCGEPTSKKTYRQCQPCHRARRTPEGLHITELLPEGDQ